MQRTGPLLSLKTKRILLLLLDAICVLIAYLFTLSFRFGGRMPTYYWQIYWQTIGFIIPIYLLFFVCFHLYSSLWEHASVDELLQTMVACLCGTLISLLFAQVIDKMLPISVYIAAGLVTMLLIGWIRMGYRVVRYLFRRGAAVPNQGVVKAMVIGAGKSGASIIKQMQDVATVQVEPVVIVDDDESKVGTRIHGIPVKGTTADILPLAVKYKVSQIIFAIPSASPQERKRILEACTQTNCELKIVPGIEAILDGIQFSNIRNVDICDLLPRPEVKLHVERISGYLADRVILITGGSGSIGSEICRQIAPFHPKKLLIFDIYENNAYELLVDLRREYGDTLDVEVLIGSIRDEKRLEEVFSTYRPEVVFHAAAHKHVPLMETSPAEAVKNNVFGTWNTARMADRYGVQRFVLISTDKAVNPTNIMGATKYLAELVMQYMNSVSQTRFVAVRFGNVLGSSGSVIPLFKRQIEQGGPVTVTHPDIERYFMTIPEAARLVIQAGSMAKEGQIFILDMGQPVKIDDVARTYIRLCGFEPDVDIKIVYTGLRPGEKMYEELLQAGEDVVESGFQGILIGQAHAIAPQEILHRLQWLGEQVEQDPVHTPCYIAKVVPTYQGKQ